MTYTGPGMSERLTAGTASYQYDANGMSMKTDSQTQITNNLTTLPDGTLISEAVGSSTYYYLSDGAGSVAMLTDSSGGQANTYSYDPMGNMTSTGSVSNPITWQGAEYNSQTGLYRMANGSLYDPKSGRCKDKGWYDTPASEDLCGEDEAPYDDVYCASRQLIGGGMSAVPIPGSAFICAQFTSRTTVRIRLGVGIAPGFQDIGTNGKVARGISVVGPEFGVHTSSGGVACGYKSGPVRPTLSLSVDCTVSLASLHPSGGAVTVAFYPDLSVCNLGFSGTGQNLNTMACLLAETITLTFPTPTG